MQIKPIANPDHTQALSSVRKQLQRSTRLILVAVTDFPTTKWRRSGDYVLAKAGWL